MSAARASAPRLSSRLDQGCAAKTWATAPPLKAVVLIGSTVSGWILESPYTDLRTAVRNRMELYLFTPLDSVAYSGLLAVAPLFLPPLDELSPEHAAASFPSDVPVLPPAARLPILITGCWSTRCRSGRRA